MEHTRKKGYSEDWIHQRLLSIRIRNELTDEWQKRGVEKGKEYAILTDEITKAWSGMSTRQYKNLKGLKKENLRDNMSDLEHVLGQFRHFHCHMGNINAVAMVTKNQWPRVVGTNALDKDFVFPGLYE